MIFFIHLPFETQKIASSAATILPIVNPIHIPTAPSLNTKYNMYAKGILSPHNQRSERIMDAFVLPAPSSTLVLNRKAVKNGRAGTKYVMYVAPIPMTV